ncbi:MAG: BON domain-containing protein [Candidatus Aminicenantes bacterium]|nr:BON domain-containing protein [Candidatus Aminicenantes bacterium]
MKKNTLPMFLLLVSGVFFMTASSQLQAQNVQTAVDLETSVRNAVLKTPQYGVFDSISFRLDGNNVILQGQVLLPITKAEIFRRVSQISGIGNVIDDIGVLPLSRRDDALRLQVYRRIFNTADLYRYAFSPNPSIHIIVRDGRVMLDGLVSNEGDSQFAAMAARKVSGVFSVTNNLEIQK